MDAAELAAQPKPTGEGPSGTVSVVSGSGSALTISGGEASGSLPPLWPLLDARGARNEEARCNACSIYYIVYSL